LLLPKKSLIISCQAEGDDPFNTPEGVSLFARAAEMGGAYGIRSEGLEKTKKIIESVNIPVIGLIKSSFSDGSGCITGSFEDVQNLITIGCEIVAIDGTNRLRDNNLAGPDYIKKIKTRLDCSVMADISTVNEAKLCSLAGADYISTTLNGYTPETYKDNNGKPNFFLVKQITRVVSTPVFAEGRISTPEQAQKMINLRTYGVVVGTAITRPRLIVKNFTEIIKSK